MWRSNTLLAAAKAKAHNNRQRNLSEEEMTGASVKRPTVQADTTQSKVEDSHRPGVASSTRPTGIGKWEAELAKMAEDEVKALATQADRTEQPEFHPEKWRHRSWSEVEPASATTTAKKTTTEQRIGRKPKAAKPPQPRAITGWDRIAGKARQERARKDAKDRRGNRR
jgi:hypothetical protein